MALKAAIDPDLAACRCRIPFDLDLVRTIRAFRQYPLLRQKTYLLRRYTQFDTANTQPALTVYGSDTGLKNIFSACLRFPIQAGACAQIQILPLRCASICPDTSGPVHAEVLRAGSIFQVVESLIKIPLIRPFLIRLQRHRNLCRIIMVFRIFPAGRKRKNDIVVVRALESRNVNLRTGRILSQEDPVNGAIRARQNVAAVLKLFQKIRHTAIIQRSIHNGILLNVEIDLLLVIKALRIGIVGSDIWNALIFFGKLRNLYLRICIQSASMLKIRPYAIPAARIPRRNEPADHRLSRKIVYVLVSHVFSIHMFYPFRPVVDTPSVRNRCIVANITKIGTSDSVAIANIAP